MANAKSWPAIEAHCAGLGISVDKLHFQQGFLADTRDGTVFIGSCSRGYFIIHDRNDAIAAAAFYKARIDREKDHLKHLKRLVRRQGWPAI